MKPLTTILLWLVTFTNAYPEAELKLILDKELYTVGSHIKASLVLDGTPITPNPEGKRESNPFFAKVDGPPALRYNYNIVAKKKGKYVLGPFSVTIGGKKLVSNSVAYTVLQPSKNGLTLSISNFTISKGKEFSITLISPKELKSPTLKKNEMFEHKSMSTSTSKGFSFSEGRSQEYKYEFIVEAKKKGTLKISKDLFEKLPEDMSFTIQAITIF